MVWWRTHVDGAILGLAPHFAGVSRISRAATLFPALAGLSRTARVAHFRPAFAGVSRSVRVARFCPALAGMSRIYKMAPVCPALAGMNFNEIAVNRIKFAAPRKRGFLMPAPARNVV